MDDKYELWKLDLLSVVNEKKNVISDKGLNCNFSLKKHFHHFLHEIVFKTL